MDSEHRKSGTLTVDQQEAFDELFRRERERCAIVLRCFADLPDEEVARLLVCRRSTVRSLVRRALTKLRKELE